MSSSSDLSAGEELRKRAENAIDIDPREISNWCQILSSCIASGIAILDSLGIANQAVKGARLQYLGYCLVQGMKGDGNISSIIRGNKTQKKKRGEEQFVTAVVPEATPPIPELAGFFATALEAGEGDGRLDSVLRELSSYFLLKGATLSSVYNFTGPELLFYRELALLQGLGLPILKSLRAIERDFAYPRMRKMIGRVIEEIESGGTFGEAMAKYPDAFSPTAVAFVQAGCAGGTLEVCLQRMCES